MLHCMTVTFIILQ